MARSNSFSANRISAPLAARISASVEESDGHRARCVSGAGAIDHVGQFGANLDAPHAGVVLVRNDLNEDYATQTQLIAAPCQFGAGEDVAAMARDSRGRRGEITCVFLLSFYKRIYHQKFSLPRSLAGAFFVCRLAPGP
jgi:hypothetical protein